MWNEIIASSITFMLGFAILWIFIRRGMSYGKKAVGLLSELCDAVIAIRQLIAEINSSLIDKELTKREVQVIHSKLNRAIKEIDDVKKAIGGFLVGR